MIRSGVKQGTFVDVLKHYTVWWYLGVGSNG